jgi:chemotaxis protein CheX
MSEELDQATLVTGLHNATTEVFSTMLGLEMTAQEAFRQSSNPQPADGVVTLIGLAGKWVGTGSICCAPEMARKLSGKLLMSEFAAVDQEVLDAMGELTNMIIGSFKNSLEELTGALGLSIPVVIYGHNFTASSAHAADWVVVPFKCNEGQLEVKVCLSPASQPPHNRRVTDVNVLV